jgi:REP element-mobilizing transposase RayT
MPGLLQHVIVRGIERRDIFLDDSDRSLFVDRFSSLLVETGMECLAWSLLTNHFHLLLRCRQVELSRFMRRLLTGYAVNFNRRHGRSGHLFQNRYKSIICEEETYLLELIRYIHLNPLRAGIVQDLTALEYYPWSGHAVVLGHEQLPGQMVDEVLLRFGRRLSIARKKYREFVAAGEGQGHRPELVGGGLRRSRQASGQEECGSFDDRILGSGAFVETLCRDREIRHLLPSKVSLLELQETVSAFFAIKPEDILRRARLNSVSEARTVFCYLAIRKLGKSGAEIGRYLGMGSSAVSRAVRRGELILADKSSMCQELEEKLGY